MGMTNIYFRVPRGPIYRYFVKIANSYNIEYKVLHNVDDAFIIKSFLPPGIYEALGRIEKVTYRTQEEVNQSLHIRAANNQYLSKL